MKTLFIDTASNKEVIVRLVVDDNAYTKKKELTTHKSQEVLFLIEGILKDCSLSMQQIDAIEVNRGPGSFTGLRVGVAVANALGFALNIPVNGELFSKGKLVEPVYTP